MKLVVTLLLPLQLFSQNVIYTYDYEGKPGEVVEYSIPSTPNSLYQFDFCAMNVPDRLTIYTPNSNISFYIGTNILDAELKAFDDYYRGYTEVTWDDVLTITKDQYPNPPPDFNCSNMLVYTPRQGMLRVLYTVPLNQCTLKFKVEGNKDDRTVYNLIVTQLEEGYNPSHKDTLIVPSCTPKNPEWVTTDCGKKYYIYNDYGIHTSALITNPSCVGSLDGSITFYNYPSYNLYNIPVGNYDITISNGVCTKEFNLSLAAPDTCNTYIPNIFNANHDVFMMYAENDVPYWMQIFDR